MICNNCSINKLGHNTFLFSYTLHTHTQTYTHNVDAQYTLLASSGSAVFFFKKDLKKRLIG